MLAHEYRFCVDDLPVYERQDTETYFRVRKASLYAYHGGGGLLAHEYRFCVDDLQDTETYFPVHKVDMTVTWQHSVN